MYRRWFSLLRHFLIRSMLKKKIHCLYYTKKKKKNIQSLLNKILKTKKISLKSHKFRGKFFFNISLSFCLYVYFDKILQKGVHFTISTPTPYIYLLFIFFSENIYATLVKARPFVYKKKKKIFVQFLSQKHHLKSFENKRYA